MVDETQDSSFELSSQNPGELWELGLGESWLYPLFTVSRVSKEGKRGLTRENVQDSTQDTETG
jgi:hypothetical protein